MNARALDMMIRLAWPHGDGSLIPSEQIFLSQDAARAAAPKLNIVRRARHQPPYTHIAVFNVQFLELPATT